MPIPAWTRPFGIPYEASRAVYHAATVPSQRGSVPAA